MNALKRRLSVAFVLSLVAAGCERSTPRQAAVVRDVAQRGPLTLTVEAEPPHVQVGDLITVRVRVETPGEYEAELPTAEAFGELEARVTDSSEARPGPQGLVWRRTFQLEPVASGTLEIPSLTVRYWRRDSTAATQPTPGLVTQPVANELLSQALKIEVRSVLSDKDDPTRPRDITGTLLPPMPLLKPWQWAAVAGAVLAAAAAVFGLARLVRRRLRRPAPPVLPEIWALRALEELAAQDWFVDPRFRDYYYRLTEIVRCYIERKFGLAAPEMTTEEFFAHLQRGRLTLPYDAERLHTFLTACDLVKYAALRPRREDADAALRTARAFIHATAANVAGPAGTPTGNGPSAAGPAAVVPSGGQAA